MVEAYKEITIKRIESSVCAIVNDVLHEYRSDIKDLACEEELYQGVTNVPYSRVLARSFCFRTMKDIYGFSYSLIAEHAGMRRLSIMKSVRKVRNGIYIDAIMMAINERIEAEISRW